MLSSRKQANVERAVKELRDEGEGVEVEGVTCHVGKPDHRTRLIEEVWTCACAGWEEGVRGFLAT